MNKNVWILAGMATQATISGSMAAFGLITLAARQQATAGGLFVIYCFVFLVVTRELHKYIFGMGIQALMTSIVFLAGLNFSYQYQLAAAFVYAAIILVIYLVKTYF